MFVILSIIFVIYILLIYKKNYIQIFMLGKVTALFHKLLVVKNIFNSFE